MTQLFPLDTQDIQLTVNGFPLTGVDDNGVEWHTSFQDVTGLFDGAGTNLETEKLAWSDGDFSNRASRAGRNISVLGYIMGACPETLLTSWETFKGALKVNSQLLEVKLGSIDRQVEVKQSAGPPLVEWAGRNMLKFSIGLTALSPYLYKGGDPISDSTMLPSNDGGMIYPVDGYHFEGGRAKTDWRFDEKITSGIVRLVSSGNAPSPVLIRIDGPVSNPIVTHSSGQSMRFRIALGTGQYITADGTNREILVDGAPPVGGIDVSREWSMAEPGTNEWQFAADSYNNQAKLTVTFREAYV